MFFELPANFFFFLSLLCFPAEEKKEEKMDTTPPADEKKGAELFSFVRQNLLSLPFLFLFLTTCRLLPLLQSPRMRRRR